MLTKCERAEHPQGSSRERAAIINDHGFVPDTCGLPLGHEGCHEYIEAARPSEPSAPKVEPKERKDWIPCPICQSDYDGVFCHACRNLRPTQATETASAPQRRMGLCGHADHPHHPHFCDESLKSAAPSVAGTQPTCCANPFRSTACGNCGMPDQYSAPKPAQINDSVRNNK